MRASTWPHPVKVLDLLVLTLALSLEGVRPEAHAFTPLDNWKGRNVEQQQAVGRVVQAELLSSEDDDAVMEVGEHRATSHDAGKNNTTLQSSGMEGCEGL